MIYSRVFSLTCSFLNVCQKRVSRVRTSIYIPAPETAVLLLLLGNTGESHKNHKRLGRKIVGGMTI